MSGRDRGQDASISVGLTCLKHPQRLIDLIGLHVYVIVLNDGLMMKLDGVSGCQWVSVGPGTRDDGWKVRSLFQPERPR